MAAEQKQANDIRKFEEIGTHSAATHLAIGEAILFHNGIGGERKETFALSITLLDEQFESAAKYTIQYVIR